MWDIHEWFVIAIVTLVGAFGVTAGIMAIGNARHDGYLGAVDEDAAAWCQADLKQLRTAKAQIESRALIAIRDLTDLQRYHTQCRAECAECQPKLAAAEQALAEVRDEKRIMAIARPALAPSIKEKPPAPAVGQSARAAKKKRPRVQAKPRPAPSWF